jgi:hypothetical protein
MRKSGYTGDGWRKRRLAAIVVAMRKSGQPTINDVARIAGVSKKTVSRVINRSPLLNDDTRKRVEDVIGELGYIPNPQARALALRRNFLIGLVHDNPNAQTVMNVQQGMLEALHDTEFEMVVRPVDRGSATMLEDLRHFLERQRLFGVLLMPPISENDSRLPDRAGASPDRLRRRPARLPLRPRTPRRVRGGARRRRHRDAAQHDRRRQLHVRFRAGRRRPPARRHPSPDRDLFQQ